MQFYYDLSVLLSCYINFIVHLWIFALKGQLNLGKGRR